MFPKHLSSDLRQYFWLSIFTAGFFFYLPVRYGGRFASVPLTMALLEAACAVAIYRRSRFAPIIYSLGCACLLVWGLMLLVAKGYSHTALLMIVGAIMCTTGVFTLRREILIGEQDQVDEDPGQDELNDGGSTFELPENKHEYVDKLADAYRQSFGALHAIHHVVPKSIWLHKYADYVVTIPPIENRPTWLYGTLLISTLSNTRLELVLERPKEDTIGAIGTLSMLTQYFLENAHLKEWNTMGTHPFYGEESEVRGLLFCKPPAHLRSELKIGHSGVTLLYVAGITEQQLAVAQSRDDAEGGFVGAKDLHEKLEISSRGIANLAL